MPLLEIANAQPSFQYPLRSLRVPKTLLGKVASISFTFGNEQRIPCAWKSLDKLKTVNFNVRTGRLLIKAVATLERKRLAANEDRCKGPNSKGGSDIGVNSDLPGEWIESSDEESIELGEKEKLRRMRISKANKGNTPWNKGRKHSAETLRKIRERTRLAMQNPKVMSCQNEVDKSWACTDFTGPGLLYRFYSKETRLKIGTGVKMRWERRREKKMVQETCCFEWQNLIAEASRQGYDGEEELQWNSYEILDKELEQEWLESVEQRKKMPRTPGSRRAPKPPEQRRKIAEAISAKWSDPEYRARVCSALAKYHGSEVRAERKPRRQTDATQSTRSSLKKKAVDTNIFGKSDTKMYSQMRLKRSKSPIYKDPLVSSKLEMIKNIRAQRAAAETEQTEAIERARLLIAEAEKAAKALEVAATKSPIAQASLIESRKLIAEAIQSLECIETRRRTESNISFVALDEVEKKEGGAFEVLNHSDMSQVNGHKASPSPSPSSDYKFSSDFGKFSLQKLLNGDPELQLTTTNGCASSPFGFDSQIKDSGSLNQPRETELDQSREYKTDPSPTLVGIQSSKGETPSTSLPVTKNWVRGRLVEVVEETQ